MGSRAEKKRLLEGMSARNSSKRMREIWAEKHATPFLQVNRYFQNEHGISLLALCEMWHRLRVNNKAVEIMIASFAQTVLSKNATIKKFENTIHIQRERLAVLEKLYADQKHTSRRGTSSKGSDTRHE